MLSLPLSLLNTDSYHIPKWFWDILNHNDCPSEGEEFELSGKKFLMKRGLPRSALLHSDAQQQTSDTFGFKWQKRETFESKEFRETMRDWANERYGSVKDWMSAFDNPLVLDAGCGAAYTAIEYFGPVLDQIRYIGADISAAVDVAKERVSGLGAEAGFIQCDITRLPIREKSLDVIFSEGVLHHTDSTENAVKSLVPLLREGGLFMFYVYKKKGPLREFSDDYMRELLQEMNPEQGWDALMPLTQLGKTLGDLDIEINIEEPIELLQIPAGKINLQRLFYWHIFKAFYRSEYSLDEMNHINFDWYAPKNAHRQTPEEIRSWCEEKHLVIEREVVEDAGITIIARKETP